VKVEKNREGIRGRRDGLSLVLRQRSDGEGEEKEQKRKSDYIGLKDAGADLNNMVQ